MEDKWRVIYRGANDPFRNMALDEAIGQCVGKGLSPKTICFYHFSKPGGITLGIKQVVEDINVQESLGLGIPFVRRPSAGMAMYHSPRDITYAVIVPGDTFPDQIGFAHYVTPWIMDALESLGIENIAYPGRYSILANQKKICGNAAWLSKELNFQLLHGSVFAAANLEAMSRISGKPKEFIEDRYSSLLLELGAENLEEQFYRQFLSHLQFEVGELTPEEKRLADHLEQTKYRTNQWNIDFGNKSRGFCNTEWGIYPELDSRIAGDPRLQRRNFYR